MRPKFCEIEFEPQRQTRYYGYKNLKAYICSHCGKSFIPKAIDRTTYCSRDCYFAGKTKRKEERIEREVAEAREREHEPKEIRICIVCGNTYEVKGKSLVCSTKCRNIDSVNKYYSNHDVILAGIRAKYWGTRESKKPFECKECGKIVIPKYENGNGMRKHFCSDKCMNRYNRRIRGNSHIKRAMYFEVEYEKVNPIDIFV